MIIDYDHNPALSDEDRLRSLVDNLILAFNEMTDLIDKQQKLIDAVIRGSGSEYDDEIAEIKSNIVAMQSDISALQDVADEAILQSTAS